MGRPLEEIATVSDFPKFLSYPKVVKVASYIDVIWFSGDTDALVPEYAFEVEHTTEVTKGLGRLFDLYKAGLRTKSLSYLKKSVDSNIQFKLLPFSLWTELRFCLLHYIIKESF